MPLASRKKNPVKRQKSSRNQYFAEIAHQLRTPLTIIKGRVELLLLNFRDHRLPEELRRELESIDEEINHMAEILAKKVV